MDEDRQAEANKAFLEILAGILNDPGPPSRKLKVQLGFRLCKQLGVNGSRGDILILIARTLQIVTKFATRIVRCSIDGKEEDLFVRKSSSTSFLNTKWAESLNDFAFQPDVSRSVPGKTH